MNKNKDKSDQNKAYQIGSFYKFFSGEHAPEPSSNARGFATCKFANLKKNNSCPPPPPSQILGTPLIIDNHGTSYKFMIPIFYWVF